MNTTIEALRGLYVAKGGNLSDVQNINTIPNMIDALTELTEESFEGSVPITSDDVNTIVNSIS